MNVISLNIRIIRVLNSCDRKQFESLISEVISRPRVFRSKLYVWNIIRGRDFYKMLAHYVVSELSNSDSSEVHYANAETIIKMVMDTAKSEEIKKSFIWAVMKQVPLVTATTIQYASHDKIVSLLQSDKVLITDDCISPFVDEIARLRSRVKDLEDELTATRLMLD